MFCLARGRLHENLWKYCVSIDCSVNIQEWTLSLERIYWVVLRSFTYFPSRGYAYIVPHVWWGFEMFWITWPLDVVTQ